MCILVEFETLLPENALGRFPVAKSFIFISLEIVLSYGLVSRTPQISNGSLVAETETYLQVAIMSSIFMR